MNNISRKSNNNAMPRQPHHYPGLRMWAALAVLVAVLASCGADRNFKKGEKFLALGEYFDAAAQYKQAYSKSKPKDRTARGLYAMRMAYCYNRINSDGKAIAAYRNAIRYGADSLQTHLDFARALLKMPTTRRRRRNSSWCSTPCQTTSWRKTDCSRHARQRLQRMRDRDI